MGLFVSRLFKDIFNSAIKKDELIISKNSSCPLPLQFYISLP